MLPPFPLRHLIQFPSLSAVLMASQSAFLQSGAPFSSCLATPPLILATIIKWSLFPSRPCSLTSSNLSGIFVTIKSRMFPFTCVGKSTICSMKPSSMASMRPAVLPLATPPSQSMSGRLKSPIRTLFFSAAFTSSVSSVIESAGALGGR